LTDVTAISAGSEYSLALKSDGTMVAWGINIDGETDVPADLTGVTAIAASLGYGIALKNDGTVVDWGSNSDGLMGVPAGLADVTAVATSPYHRLALKNDGTVVAWGSNGNGETDVHAGLAGVTAISAGSGYSMALLTLDGPSAPEVTVISPTNSTKAGGTIVTIIGTNFTGATEVRFGDTPASVFTVTSDTSLTATAPAATAVGPVHVTVTSVHGASTTSSVDQFTYTYAFTGFFQPVDNHQPSTR
jgi:hypothetical protein